MRIWKFIFVRMKCRWNAIWMHIYGRLHRSMLWTCLPPESRDPWAEDFSLFFSCEKLVLGLIMRNWSQLIAANLHLFPYTDISNSQKVHYKIAENAYLGHCCREKNEKYGFFEQMADNVVRRGLKKRKKLHRSRNKFALRCVYRRTVDEIYFDCGANFGVFLTEKNRDKLG